MIPSLTSNKKPSCFSIDSLISKADAARIPPQPRAPASPPSRESPPSSPLDPLLQGGPHGVGPRGPLLPPCSIPAPHPALIHGANTVYPGGLPPGFDPLFGMNPAALLSHPMQACFPGGPPRGMPIPGGPHGQHPPPHAGMLGQGKDSAPFYSWLLARHGNLLGQRFAGQLDVLLLIINAWSRFFVW